MDNKDVIIIMLTIITLYLTWRLQEVEEKLEIADKGWLVALMHLRENNVPLPTHEESSKYLKEVGKGW